MTQNDKLAAAYGVPAAVSVSACHEGNSYTTKKCNRGTKDCMIAHVGDDPNKIFSVSTQEGMWSNPEFRPLFTIQQMFGAKISAEDKLTD